MSRLVLRRCLLAIAAWQTADHGAALAQEKFWALSPYEMHIAVAVDDTLRPQPRLAETLTAYLVDRIDATLNPLWQADVVHVAPRQVPTATGGLEERDFEQLPADLHAYDKLQTLLAVATPTGWQLQCREYDAYARRWGSLETQFALQPSFLPEQCFQLLLQAFAPTASIEADRETPDLVELTFRGSELPRRSDEALFVDSGQVYLPLLRRTNRAGELVGGEARPVPWTYLTTIGRLDEKAGRWQAEVHSGQRRPFGVRRRGNVQELALAVHPVRRPTRIRFYARTAPERGLAGYEIHRRTGADNSTTYVGATDADGVFVLEEPGDEVVTLFLRSEGQLLAKVPVVPGAVDLVEVPIADDPARLRAQAELTVIREQLVDLVAQRAILMARARAALDAGDVAQAQQMVNELSNLPSRSVFDQQIAAAERGAAADELEDPQVQAQIEKMFTDTRNLLGRFLDSRPITQLQTDVSRAAKEGN